MREGKIEKKCCEWAAANGWLVRKLAWIGRVGAPDRLFIKKGFVVFVEFKRPGGALSAPQKRELRRLLIAGAHAHHVASVGEFKSLMEVYDENL